MNQFIRIRAMADSGSPNTGMAGTPDGSAPGFPGRVTPFNDPYRRSRRAGHVIRFILVPASFSWRWLGRVLFVNPGNKTMQEKTKRGASQLSRISDFAHAAHSSFEKGSESPAVASKHSGRNDSVRAGDLLAAVFGIFLLTLPASAYASFLPPEMMSSMAMGVAWFVIIVMPIGAIVLFWLVHVLPEKIAHKRHHPQADAIHTLCLLSLAFGGLLWPLAWLWAYVKPVAYRSAYGTDKHDSYFHHMGERALAGELQQYELDHLREELDMMAEKGTLSADLKVLRKALASAEAAPVPSRSGPAATDTQAGAV